MSDSNTPADKPLKADIDFLFEMGSIRFIRRTWQRFLGEDFANLAEHHFRVFWIANSIAANEQKTYDGVIDTGKIAKLAMVHDIAESRTGDVDYLSRQYVERNEELGIHDILANTALEAEFLALWQEYEDRETIESKIVKDADNLDVDFELAEQAARGSSLPEVKRPQREMVARDKLYTETAKQLAIQMRGVSPHDWHWHSRNRGNAGDWTPTSITT